MASRSTYPVSSMAREIIQIFGSFFPAGTGAPTSLEAQGVASVTRTGVGTFLVTLQDRYAALVDGNVTIQLATAADTVGQLGTYDSSAKTIVVRVLTAGVAADITAGANNRVFFRLAFRNSSIK